MNFTFAFSESVHLMWIPPSQLTETKTLELQLIYSSVGFSIRTILF